MNGHILYTYPRSGNTWTRYIFECITGYPSQGTLDNLEHDPPIYKRRSGIPVNPNLPPKLFKRHYIGQLTKEDFALSMIVIMRNYKECVIRQAPKILDDSSLIDHEFGCYFDTIRIFHEHQLPKLLIYYEDLIQSPKEVIRTFGDFVNAPKDRIDEFLNKYEEHRLQSISKYEAGSQTLGNKIHFHQKKLSPETCQLWDEKMESISPEIYTRYLSQYKSL